MSEDRDFDLDEMFASAEEIGSDDQKEYEELRKQLEERCKAASIPFETLREEDDHVMCIVHMPCGSKTRQVFLYDLDYVNDFLAIPFENYSFLGDYAAICSYKDGYIEAGVKVIGMLQPALQERSLLRRLGIGFKKKNDKWSIVGDGVILESSSDRVKLQLCRCSNEFEELSDNAPSFGLTLKIIGLNISQHDQALELLQSMTDALFFQIDTSFNVPLALRRDRSLKSVKISKTTERYELEFPRSAYDGTPMQLYWYARSATGMPLLQFLAYYQAIEYYFPTYSKADAIRKIRNIIKDPGFRYNNDTYITKILNAIHSSGGRAFGNERSQLKATLEECINADELRAFIKQDEERAKHFTAKKKGITDHKIHVDGSASDLINSTADRIYDIRCKIVHTKVSIDEDTSAMILPFSEEADSLLEDIALIRNICKSVLVTTSTPLYNL